MPARPAGLLGKESASFQAMDAVRGSRLRIEETFYLQEINTWYTSEELFEIFMFKLTIILLYSASFIKPYRDPA